MLVLAGNINIVVIPGTKQNCHYQQIHVTLARKKGAARTKKIVEAFLYVKVALNVMHWKLKEQQFQPESHCAYECINQKAIYTKVILLPSHWLKLWWCPGNWKREAVKRENVIIGDFNYPRIDWVTAHLDHDKKTKYLAMINDCAFKELCTMELRKQKTTLDLILNPVQKWI